MKNALAIWLWLCVYLQCAGWFLSAIGQLNATGYAIALAIGVIALLIVRTFWPPPPSPRKFCPERFFRRFRRPFPFAFLILSGMAFVGGALYGPSNYDALAYRVPRVLNWLATGHWNWIHTIFPRVNASSCGVEWVSAPLIVFFKTDRLLFLLSFISFLFLPGLVFSVLTRLGVRCRAAWHWMWVAPTGYCFLLQAGSIGNDLFSAPFALAAIDFALRSKNSKQSTELSYSILAAALMTSTKFSNLPLLLPWVIALLPSIKIFLQRPIPMAAVCFIAFFASFLPKAIINEHFCHDWSGVSMENDQPHGNLFAHVAANAGLVTVLNFTPPIFPEADKWNLFVQKTLPPGWLNILTEPAAAGFCAPDMQTEESAALGLGVTVLLVISIGFAVLHHRKSFFQLQFNSPDILWQKAIVLAPWLSMLALLARSEVYPIGRILAPYYLLLLPLLLASPAQERLVKKLWWRIAVFIVFVVSAALLILSPARPLFPAVTILEKIQARHPDSRIVARAQKVYSIYHNRNHAFAPVIDDLPPGLKTLGFIGYDDPETSLWHPFGSRKIVHVCPNDSASDLKACGIEYILAKDDMFDKQFPGLDNWLKKMNAQVVQDIHLDLRVTYNPKDWYLIKLN